MCRVALLWLNVLGGGSSGGSSGRARRRRAGASHRAQRPHPRLLALLSALVARPKPESLILPRDGAQAASEAKPADAAAPRAEAVRALEANRGAPLRGSTPSSTRRRSSPGRCAVRPLPSPRAMRRIRAPPRLPRWLCTVEDVQVLTARTPVDWARTNDGPLHELHTSATRARRRRACAQTGQTRPRRWYLRCVARSRAVLLLLARHCSVSCAPRCPQHLYCIERRDLRCYTG